MTNTELEVERPEPLSQRAARRLRGCLAENQISQSHLASVIRMPQQKLSRKLTGFTPLTIDEIDTLAWALRIDVDAILGTGQYADRPIGIVEVRASETKTAPGGGTMFLPGRGLRRSLCANRDLNPEPADSEPDSLLTIHGGGCEDTVVIPFPVRLETVEVVMPRPSLELLVGGAA